MKYIKRFLSHSDYEEFIETSGFVRPNISCCVDEGNKIHYNRRPRDNRLVVTYNVSGESTWTALYNYQVYQGIVGVNMFDKIEIDGVEVSVSDIDSSEGWYELNEGEHVVTYYLKDSTMVPNMSFAIYPSRITSVSVPKSVTTIGMGAFDNSHMLSSVTLTNRLQAIKEEAFCDCENLSSINMPSTIREIGNYAFCRCTSLDEDTLSFILSVNENATLCNDPQ